MNEAHGTQRTWKDTMGRIGLVGRGVLYAVIGFLALDLALGSPDAEASSDGAFHWVAQRTFGRVLLVALTIALFLLAIWRFLDAAVGDPVEGDEPSDRLRFAGKGAIYTALAIGALTTTLAAWGAGSDSGGGSGSTEKRATGVVLNWPAGQWLVAAVGLGLIGYAVFMLKHHAVDASFRKRLTSGAGGIIALGRAGYAARSVVWTVSGILLVQAAITYDPEKAGGLSASLYKMATVAWGSLLLGLVAVGLFGFGAFCVAEARYRRAA